MPSIKIKQRRNGGWVGVQDERDCGLHITRNDATQLFTVWDWDSEETVADSVPKAEAERAAAKYIEAS